MDRRQALATGIALAISGGAATVAGAASGGFPILGMGDRPADNAAPAAATLMSDSEATPSKVFIDEMVVIPTPEPVVAVPVAVPGAAPGASASAGVVASHRRQASLSQTGSTQSASMAPEITEVDHSTDGSSDAMAPTTVEAPNVQPAPAPAAMAAPLPVPPTTSGSQGGEAEHEDDDEAEHQQEHEQADEESEGND